jgi:hypothetical protein
MGRALGAGFVTSLALVVVAVTNDCAPATPVTAAAGTAPPDTAAVVLVTLDGVRWQEIFDGVDPALAARVEHGAWRGMGPRELLPNIHRLFFDEGVALGDPRLLGGIEATAPRHMSIPGYVELSTGAATDCADNACVPVLGETLADAVASAGTGAGASANADGRAGVGVGADGGAGDASAAAIFGSWPDIARVAGAHPERLLVRTGKAIAADVPAFPGNGDYVPDRLTAARALVHLRASRPRLLWVALGDTDEWAHRGDYGGYLDALRAADRFLGDLVEELAHQGDRGARTAILVTADHGRDAGFVDHGGPDSGAVWLLARGPRVPRQGAMPTARKRRLRDVAPTARAWLGLPPRACATCGEPIGELLAMP